MPVIIDDLGLLVWAILMGAIIGISLMGIFYEFSLRRHVRKKPLPPPPYLPPVQQHISLEKAGWIPYPPANEPEPEKQPMPLADTPPKKEYVTIDGKEPEAAKSVFQTLKFRIAIIIVGVLVSYIAYLWLFVRH
jgi:hypothetical protein